MTAEQSLNIIRKTIEESRREINRNIWKSMLLWGVSVTVIALVVGHLWKHSSMGPGANGLWGLLGIVAAAERMMQRNKPRLPQTFVSKTLAQVWTSFGIMAGAFGFTTCIMALLSGLNIFTCPLAGNGLKADVYIPVTAIIIMSMGVAGMISGMVLSNRLITLCCFISGLAGGFLAIFLIGPMEMIVMAGASIIGLVLPALLIKARKA